MICGIYAIVNRETGKTYVGKATNIAKRWTQHRRAISGPTRPRGAQELMWLECAGEVDTHFEFKVLERTDTIDTAERAWEDRLRRQGVELYNARKCGGSPGRHSDEARMKMSAAATGRKHTPSTRAKMSASRRGAKNHLSRPVVNLDTGQVFETCLAASIAVGRSKQAVGDALHRGGRAAGFRWAYAASGI